MTVSAIARVTQAYIGPPDNETSPDNTYYVVVYYWVTDGTTAHEGQQSALIPVEWGERRANRYVRERTAAIILAAYSLTIDPENIYIPLST